MTEEESLVKQISSHEDFIAALATHSETWAIFILQTCLKRPHFDCLNVTVSSDRVDAARKFLLSNNNFLLTHFVLILSLQMEFLTADYPASLPTLNTHLSTRSYLLSSAKATGQDTTLHSKLSSLNISPFSHVVRWSSHIAKVGPQSEEGVFCVWSIYQTLTGGVSHTMKCTWIAWHYVSTTNKTDTMTSR